MLIKPVGKIPRPCTENRGATANKQSTQTHSQTLNGPDTHTHTHITTSKGFSHKVYVQNCKFKTLLVFKTNRSNEGMHAKTCYEKSVSQVRAVITVIHAPTCSSALYTPIIISVLASQFFCIKSVQICMASHKIHIKHALFNCFVYMSR